MDNHYGGVIWTNHAIERMRSRGIKQGDAWATWNRPEQSRPGTGSRQGAWVYYRTWGSQKIEVVAKQVEKPPAHRAYGPAGREWIIISVWSDAVSPISLNTPTSSGKTSFWRNLYRILFK